MHFAASRKLSLTILLKHERQQLIAKEEEYVEKNRISASETKMIIQGVVMVLK